MKIRELLDTISTESVDWIRVENSYSVLEFEANYAMGGYSLLCNEWNTNTIDGKDVAFYVESFIERTLISEEPIIEICNNAMYVKYVANKIPGCWDTFIEKCP